MSAFFPAVSGGGAGPNPNRTYEYLGIPNAAGTQAGTTVTAGSPANTMGSWVELGAAGTVNAWSKMRISIGEVSNTSSRYILEFGTDNSTANLISGGLFVEPKSNDFTHFDLPLKVAATTKIYCRMQASTASLTAQVGIVGSIALATDPPGFSSLVGLNIDQAATHAGLNDVAIQGLTGTTWTNPLGTGVTTSANYGALLCIASDTATTPTAAAQTVMSSLALGASGSEVELIRWLHAISTTAPAVPRAAAPIIEASVTSGSRITVMGRAATTGDSLRFGILGFVA